MIKLKRKLLASVTLGTLLTSTKVLAGGMSSWGGIAISGATMVLGILLSLYMGPRVVWQPTINADPAQLVAEFLVYNQLKDTKDNWEPEPQDTYQKAAENNGGCNGSGGGSSSATKSLSSPLKFEIASLVNIGIEAVGVGAGLGEIATDSTRSEILTKLAFCQEKSVATVDPSEESTSTTAGSCSAPYSICIEPLTSEKEEEIIATQNENLQNYGTAGIAHAELGLKSVQQAIVDDVGAEATSASQEGLEATLETTKVTQVQNLKGLIGKGGNTVAEMKIVALMNLELAQRLNQGNMLQGSALTIEAARAFPDTVGLTDY